MTRSIGDFPWFSALSGEQRQRLDRQITRRSFQRGELVIGRGDPTRSVYLVASGRILAVHWTEQGREIVYNSIGPGEVFGELSAIAGLPRSLSLYAQSRSELLELPGDVLTELIDTAPSVRRAVLVRLVERIRELTERVHDLTSLSVQQRVRAHLLRLALESQVFRAGGLLRDPPTHAEIGNSIGANREAVSRCLSDLARAGVLESGRKWIRLLRPDALLPD